ncbi:MAG: hypothetical protein ACI8P9_000798 [Parasphingorhabdus sp.]|jgi:hypothetical protein
MVQLTLYTRYGCHLCEDMIEHLQALQKEHAFELELRDVDGDAQWFQLYNELVPLLEYDGEELCRYFLDQQKLLTVINT